MRGLFGMLLLVTGVYVGSYVYFPSAMDQHLSLVRSTHLLASVDRDVYQMAAVPVLKSSRNFSPNRHLQFVPAPIASPQLKSQPRRARERRVYFGDTPTPVRVTALQIPDPDRHAAIEESNKPASILRPWTTVVTSAPSQTHEYRLTSSAPADGASRYALIRDIQSELKRVGCYRGKIDGNWGPASKRAMVSFTAQINASLPTRNPDFILLSLVQSQNASVCGKTCFNGQCNSGTILAKQKKRRSTITTASITSPPKPIRVSQWSQVATAHPSQTQSGLTTPPVTSTNTAYRNPLPGRMTVGGPRTARLSTYEGGSGIGTYPAATQYMDDSLPGQNSEPIARVKPRKLPRAKRKARSANKKRAGRKRVSRARKRSYRRRRSNPLRSLLTQGVN